MKETLTDIATRLRRIAPLDDQDEPDEHSQVQAPSIDPDRLKTPLTPAAIERAQASVGELLESSDSSLVDRLNEVQEYVEGHEYVDRHGNAFFERLVERDDDPDSLIEIVAVRDRTVCFVSPGEVWAQVTHDLGLTDSESRAVADAHQLYADSLGLEAYAPNVRLMCVAVGEHRRADLLEQTDVSRPSEGSEDGTPSMRRDE